MQLNPKKFQLILLGKGDDTVSLEVEGEEILTPHECVKLFLCIFTNF